MAIGHLLRPYATYLNGVRNEEVEYIEFSDVELKHFEKELRNEMFTNAESVGKNLVIYIGKYAIYIDLGMHGRVFLKKWEAKNPNLVKLRLKIGNRFFFIYAPTVIRVYPKGQIRF